MAEFLGLDHRFRDDPLVVRCREDLVQRVVLSLSWTSPPLPWLGCLLRRLSRSRLIGLPYRDEAVALDRLHRQAAAGGGPADRSAQAAGALPFDQRHPYGLAGGDLGEEGGYGQVCRAGLLLLQGDCESARRARTYPSSKCRPCCL
jgi:hypothetical protein